jgi:hypothetical protein
LRAVYELMTLAQRANADQEDLRLREAEASATLVVMVGGNMDTERDDYWQFLTHTEIIRKCMKLPRYHFTWKYSGYPQVHGT